MAAGLDPVFTITARSDGSRVVLEPVGEFDLAARDHAAALLREVEAARPATLVIDLRGLRYIDSSGISVLVNARRRCDQTGRRLLLVPGPPVVQQPLVMCGLQDFFEWVPDPQEVPAGS